jgi:hypothetical protein
LTGWQVVWCVGGAGRSEPAAAAAAGKGAIVLLLGVVLVYFKFCVAAGRSIVFFPKVCKALNGSARVLL